MNQDQYDVLLMRLVTAEAGIQELLRRTRTLERQYNEELVRTVAHLCRTIDRIDDTLKRVFQPPPS